MYRTLFDVWGPQHWWPAESPFEVIVGALLTQNTAWANVERAMANLRRADCLSIPAVREVSIEVLEQIIRPSGYFRQKAERLKTFVHFLDSEYGGDIHNMFAQQTEILREQLLRLDGVGPETADSILLYAGNHPVFVIDAYTRRIFERHGLADPNASYDHVRLLVEGALCHVSNTDCPTKRVTNSGPYGTGTAHPPSAMSTARREPIVQLFNQMHALIVGVGKNYCFKKQPDCAACPLRRFLPRSPDVVRRDGH